VGEQVTTEQRLGDLLEHHLRLPVVRNVRRVDLSNLPANQLPSDVDDLSVAKWARLAIAHVVERQLARGDT
jgi:hypothetical protein